MKGIVIKKFEYVRGNAQCNHYLQELQEDYIFEEAYRRMATILGNDSINNIQGGPEKMA